MAQITINEGLAWLKTLKKRHEELLVLRNDNDHRERRFYGAFADKEIVKVRYTTSRCSIGSPHGSPAKSVYWNRR
jgi:hypothetical protein